MTTSLDDRLREIGAGEPPWHAGELALQELVGNRDAMLEVGQKYIRSFLLDQHREFFAALPYLVLGSVDEKDDVWATLRSGEPGFVATPDDRTLVMKAPRDRQDPAEYGLNSGGSVGVLGIQFETRRRNRLNGRIRDRDAGSLTLTVEQSFGNCPRYIHLRDVAPSPDDRANRPTSRRTSVADARQLVERSDCFFVASFAESREAGRQVDVSFRGGGSGFVRCESDGSFMVPDFNGNGYFNTLGNFVKNPRAGVTFVDFEKGSLLQMTGKVDVLLDSPEIAAFEGAERLWRFRPSKMIWRANAFPLRLKARPGGQSPFLPGARGAGG